MPRPSKVKPTADASTGGWIVPVRRSEAAREDLLDILNCDEKKFNGSLDMRASA